MSSFLSTIPIYTYVIVFILSIIIIGLYIWTRNLKKQQVRINYLSTASKTVSELVKKNLELEKKIEKFKRPHVGATLSWESCREDKAAYLLRLNNDSPEKIYNIAIEIDERYVEYVNLFCKKNECDSESTLDIFFIPGGWTNLEQGEATREKFVSEWLKNDLEPILFTIKYTKTPLKKNFLSITIDFTTIQISKHLSRKISNHKRSKLAIISE